MPKDARAFANSSTKLVVRWAPPLSPNGNLTFYLVRWQQQSEDRELYQHNYCSKGLRSHSLSPTESLSTVHNTDTTTQRHLGLVTWGQSLAPFNQWLCLKTKGVVLFIRRKHFTFIILLFLTSATRMSFGIHKV